MKLKVKKLNQKATLPYYSKKGDAGADLVATSVNKDNSLYWEYGTDLAMEIPNGYCGFIFPRSSISKTSHQLRNSVGVIDSGYRGEVKIRMSHDHSDCQYEVGDKIAQLIIMKLPFVEILESKILSTTDRADGGFGSTGK